jgi:diguanylate cyclase (GGDEF)-like protein/PAS domain S-box-containing protein
MSLATAPEDPLERTPAPPGDGRIGAHSPVDDTGDESLRFVRQLIDTIPSPVFYKDRDGRYLGANRAFEQLTGKPVAALIGRTVLDLYRPELAQRYAAADAELLANPGTQTYEAEVELTDGSRRAVMFNKATFARADGSIGGLVGVILDISEIKATERELHELHARLELAVDASQLAMWELDVAANRVHLDHRWALMLGLPPQPPWVDGAELLAGVHRDDLPGTLQAAVAALRGSAADFDRELRVRAADGRWRWIRCVGRVVERDADGRALRAIGTNQDIDARKAGEQQIVHRANHDYLTELPNRYALTRRLDQELARAARLNTMVALCMFDLDDFKAVNDRYGHAIGDRLLRELAARLRALVREVDFLARLGGDEFVIVIADLEQRRAADELDALLTRVHHAVDQSFDSIAPRPLRVGMSGGVALYPLDANDADALLREADVAMYAAKRHKVDRTRWWHARSSRQEWISEADVALDAFGSRAAELIERHRELLDTVADEYLAAFFDVPGDAGAPAAHGAQRARQAIFATLRDDERERLRDAQRACLAEMLSASAPASRIADTALRIGCAHALVGVGAGMLVEEVDRFRALLDKQLIRSSMLARDRYRMRSVIDARLQLQLRAQLGAHELVLAQYTDLLSDPLPAHGTLWADVVAEELPQLGALAGMRGVTLMRLASNGAFAVESNAGPVGERLADALQGPHGEAVVDPHSPRGQGLTAQAWRSGEICSSPAYALDARYAAWRGRAEALGIRASLSVPVRDAAGNAVAVLSFFGAYPNQFESSAMRQFARGVQQRWEQLWSRCTTPAPVVAQQRARALRERLFAGGFTLHLQPVVDLRSGRLLKVEGLGRLLLDDGEVVGPGLFLPLLGDAELDHLFRLGLDQVLAALVALEARGVAVDVSLNLAPGTLLDPACPAWVDDALRRHGVAPQRLHLELLESGELDASAQDEAVARLTRLGIKLAMDDLGAGYSSLQRLSALPFDSIKIDQSLTLNLRRAPLRSLPLIRSLIQLARDLERQVVVEGLEDAGMIEAALALGADLGQGYGIARPMPLDAVVRWHAAWVPPPAGGPRTFLGALAHQWLLTQRDAEPRQARVAAFLRGRAEPDAAEWLRRLDAGADPRTQHALLHWLVERAAQE